MAARVAKARGRLLRERFKDHPIRTNAEAEGELLTPSPGLDRPVGEIADRGGRADEAVGARLSSPGAAGGAGTIADLAGVPDGVNKAHIAEALSYRRLALARLGTT